MHEVRADLGPTDRSLAIGIYRPEFPDHLSSLDAYEQAGTGRVALVHWYALWGGWKAAFNLSDLEAVRRRGSLPMITWEPWAGTPAEAGWTLTGRILSG